MISDRINHVAMAVPDIEAFLDTNRVLYGRFERGPLIENVEQRVREVFLRDGDTVVELLEPLGEQSPLDGFLKKHPAGGLLHIALDVEDLDAALAEVEAAGGKTVVAPVPDVAFGGRRIAFVFLGGQITELIEKAPPPA
jgi:methylmalonyl-CoA/ethylmalonyl-CoA epimerase